MRIQGSRFKIQDSKFRFVKRLATFTFLLFCCLCVNISAQSNAQNFPTPITANEISGVIKARDLGDGRSTIYFYAFNGMQGDVFVNVQTENFNGDIDVFTVEGLKSLTKIVVYADASDNETGRVIYLRKPEKLLLRIEGRSPNDDAAKFRIKFAGSFAALTGADKTEVPAEPTVKSANDSDIKVNSVGTIISIKPKPVPVPKEVAAAVKPVEPIKKINEKGQEISEAKTEKNTEDSPVVEPQPKENELEVAAENQPVTAKPEVVVTDNNQPVPIEKKIETVQETEKNIVGENNASGEIPKRVVTKAARRNAERKKAADEAAALKKSETAALADVLANLKLIVLFKDGTKTERSMIDVLKVGVDNGVLTVITKDGTIRRYSIIEVAKFSIE